MWRCWINCWWLNLFVSWFAHKVRVVLCGRCSRIFFGFGVLFCWLGCTLLWRIGFCLVGWSSFCSVLLLGCLLQNLGFIDGLCVDWYSCLGRMYGANWGLLLIDCMFGPFVWVWVFGGWCQTLCCWLCFFGSLEEWYYFSFCCRMSVVWWIGLRCVLF